MPTRNELEQEALTQIQRGQLYKAVHIYVSILRLDAKDKRIRQRLGELYLKLDKPAEAKRQFREVADQAMREGQPRNAVAMFKQLLTMDPDDAEVMGLLGDAYREADQGVEAQRVYEQAINLFVSQRAPDQAADYARKLLDLRPTDIPLRFRIADHHVSAGRLDRALEGYRELAEILRRRGDMGEMARVLDAAIHISPEDHNLRIEAAKARIIQREPLVAIDVLRPVLATRSRDPQVLEVLAQALLDSQQDSEARPLLLHLADHYQDTGNAEARSSALRRALQAGADDPGLRELVGEVDRQVEQLKKKLTDMPVLAATDDNDLAVCTRSDVFLEYGFSDRAEMALQDALLGRPESLALLARLSEVLLVLGRREEAMEKMQRGLRLARGQAREAFADRLRAMGADIHLATPKDEFVDDDLIDDEITGDGLAGSGSSLPLLELNEDDFLDDDEMMDLNVANSATLPAVDLMARAETLEAQGDLVGATDILLEALRSNPSDEGALMRMATIKRRIREETEAAAPPPDASEPDPPFPWDAPPPEDDDPMWAALLAGADTATASVEPPSLDPPFVPTPPTPATAIRTAISPPRAMATSSGSLDDARALCSVSLYDEALHLVEHDVSLQAKWIEARCRKELGDPTQARNILKDAVDEGAEDDPFFLDALFEMAGLLVVQGRLRPALRVLEEIRDLDENWRSRDVADRLRGVQILLERNR